MFIPRSAFAYPLHTPSWYAGHMAKSVRLLPELLHDVDLLIEARDARLPLSGANSVWEGLVERTWGFGGGTARRWAEVVDEGDEEDLLDPSSVAESSAMGASVDRAGRRRERMLVFTKRDLAEERYEEPLRKAFWQHAGQRVLFADTRVDSDAKRILNSAVRLAKERGTDVEDLKVLVVGMPNVGKSSLLNALRRAGVQKGKAFITGAEPGVTRRLTGTVKVHEDPKVYVYDTPGVMVPFLGHGSEGAERGLKLALTVGIKGSLFEQDVVADYLLYKLNLRLAAEDELSTTSRHQLYTSSLPFPPGTQPTNSLPALAAALAARLGALRKGAEPDTESATAWLLRHFREGKMGRWTLDDLDGAEAAMSRRLRGRAPTKDERAAEADAVELDEALAAAGPEATSSMAVEQPPTPELEEVSDEADDPRTLDERVSDAVAVHINRQKALRIEVEEGRGLSKSQIRKAEVRAKAEAARAKQRQRAAKH